jgi:PAS domain S-box-containing protein
MPQSRNESRLAAVPDSCAGAACPASDHALRAAALAVSAAQGRAVFPELTRCLATMLGVDFAMIAALGEEEPWWMRTLAIYGDGMYLDGVEYPLAGTPCESVVGQSFRCYREGVMRHFRADAQMAQLGIDGYAGYPIDDARGRPLGIIAALSRRPIADPDLAESMMKIFAARAGAEIERTRAEEALRASEEQYRAIFNASADALMLWNSGLQRVDVNPAHEKIFGYAREDVVGRAFEGLPYPEELVRPRLEMLRRALAGEACRAELEAVRKDGQRVFTELRTIPFLHHGEAHVLQIARDITERKRAEEERTRLEAQLRQAQKMEAIGQLAGGIAHDFNNILTAVMGYVALAAERPVAAADPKIARHLEQALASCGRARDLIRQMLTFSRGQRGQPRPLRPGPLVAESMRLLRSTLPATIELEADTDGEVPAVLHDPVQLGQVVLNLCINARDAIGAGGGKIRAAVRHACDVQLACTACREPLTGDFVALSISDTGCGIPPEILDRIFEPFFTTKEVGKGSGMGLATVHGIVHEHGGHVVVESGPGGTCFSVLMPALGDGAPLPAAPAAPERSPGRKPLRGRVMVVDDEPSVAGFLHELLEGWGLEVTVAPDGQRAAGAFEAAPDSFDLVIADRTMPGMTGVELARHLAALRPSLPVVLCTGYADERTMNDALAAGARAVLAKPVEPASLRALLETCLPGP